MTDAVDKIIKTPIGMYFVQLQVDNPSLLGSPILELSLSVVEATGVADGWGKIGRAVTPEAPAVNIPQITGRVFQTGFDDDLLLVHLTGEFIASVPEGIGTYVGPFSAAFAVSRDWKGTGAFAYGRFHSERCDVANLGGQARKGSAADADLVTA
jgi:hypothetical protein